MSSDWCAGLKDSARINDLAIPGTHDAAAWTYDLNAMTPGTYAQRKKITEQLDLGIRVLDLRVGWASSFSYPFRSIISMFHGPMYLEQTLQEVLTAINTWLGTHPQEFVILIFQQQGKAPQSDAAADIKQMVRTTFGTKLTSYNPVGPAAWPTVGQMRGKVLVLGRLKSNVDIFYNVREWLSTGDNTDGAVINVDGERNMKIYLQDRYKELSSPYVSRDADNKAKFAKVKAAAGVGLPTGVTAGALLRINHMSYSNLRYQPWQSGEGVNKLLRESTIKIQGVLMIDDADQATVDHILSNNAGQLK
jgi:hypothetical protein